MNNPSIDSTPPTQTTSVTIEIPTTWIVALNRRPGGLDESIRLAVDRLLRERDRAQTYREIQAGDIWLDFIEMKVKMYTGTEWNILTFSDTGEEIDPRKWDAASRRF